MQSALHPLAAACQHSLHDTLLLSPLNAGLMTETQVFELMKHQSGGMLAVDRFGFLTRQASDQVSDKVQLAAWQLLELWPGSSENL